MGQSAIGPLPKPHSLRPTKRASSRLPAKEESKVKNKQCDGVQEPTHNEPQQCRRRSSSHSGDWDASNILRSPIHSPEKKDQDVFDFPASTVKVKDDWIELSASAARELDLCRSHSMSDLHVMAVETQKKRKLQAESKTSPTPLRLESVLERINSGANINALDEEGDAFIHTLLKRKKKDKLETLLALLINSEVDVNCQNSKGDTALHIAIQKEDIKAAKALIAFGASINKQNSEGFTPFDLVVENGSLLHLESVLIKLGGMRSLHLRSKSPIHRVPRMHSLAENVCPPSAQSQLTLTDRIGDFINKQGTRRFYRELQSHVEQIRSEWGLDENENFAIHEQEKELAQYNRTQQLGGSRILFLDGGGIKGLIQLEILMQIEEATGRSVVELFDWIVGTSTGGVIALALVYGKKSLRNLRQLYFKLKDRVFAHSRYGFGYDSKALDEVLQEYLDPDIRMTDASHPKVLVAAVNKATTNLGLHFFNNCFGDEYCNYPVWKVARYTSAAPLYFTEVDNYVDGGLICNNPTEYGLTAIQDFCRKQGIDLPISVVVSVGSGQNPAKPIGVVDAQEALFFGKQWLRPDKLINVTQNFFQLLSNALVESDLVTTNSKCRCRELNIPFFRFSPKLNEEITAGETDNEKLFHMIIKTKHNLRNGQLSELIELFHSIAEVQNKLKPDPSQSARSLAGLPCRSPVFPKRCSSVHLSRASAAVKGSKLVPQISIDSAPDSPNQQVRFDINRSYNLDTIASSSSE